MSNNFTVDDIKKIRDLTGVGLTEAKKALLSHANFQEALKAMQIKGLQKTTSRQQRTASAGVIKSYVHEGRIGVLVEVNCETDFVAKNEAFLAFVHDVALQIAASSPLYLKEADLPAADLDLERELLKKQALTEKIPTDRLDDVVAARLRKNQATKCLLTQSFNKDPQMTVGDLLQKINAQLGEKIVIQRFVRFELGVSTTILADDHC